jgi:hypothetical protein
MDSFTAVPRYRIEALVGSALPNPPAHDSWRDCGGETYFDDALAVATRLAVNDSPGRYRVRDSITGTITPTCVAYRGLAQGEPR